ncbi:MAG: DUF4198 domain-containing protein [Gemmataceae bacterium]
MRLLLATVALGLMLSSAAAHFVYVVPNPDATSITVVFSDSLNADENVTTEKIAGLKLTAIDATGATHALTTDVKKHSIEAKLGTVKPRVIHGTVVYGVMARGGAKPSLLVYHPKAVTAGIQGESATIGAKAALELIPVVEKGSTRFRLLAAGQPLADAEGSLLTPDGKKEKLKTDKEGYTVAVTAPGRYAIWLRHTEAKTGEHDGTKYEEIKHYATLVADVSK